jgi:two-component system, sensor histidine kinase and response regulator
MSRSELLGVLIAYRLVQAASWPRLHPHIATRARGWIDADEKALAKELADLVIETDAAKRPVRVFWKTGANFVFAGCNDHFARDAGFESAKGLIGKTDFDDGVAWQRQAAKYRRDDQEVVQTGVAKLDILERQDTPDGVAWLRTGKAPIRGQGGQVVGVLGMYEVIDATTAAQLTRKGK